MDLNKTACVVLENINFKDEESMPNLIPPIGFIWEFVAGGWALRPNIGLSVPTTLISASTPVAQDNLHSSSAVVVSSYSNYDSDDTISEFEKNLRVLLPDLPAGGEADHSHGTRRSERKKKPSLRFNEEAGYITETPKSSKKKGIPRRL